MRFFNKIICYSFLVLANTALAEETNTDLTDKLIELKGTISSINEELSDQRAQIGEIKAQNNYQEKVNKEILNEIKALRRQNQSVIDSLYAPNKNADDKNMEVKPLKNYDIITPDGKMLFGEDEYIYIKEANTVYDARIDTGAATSSISAQDITEFERKGKKWIRFKVVANDREVTIEAPFVRYSDIRQAAQADTIKRYVVTLTIKVGDYSTSTEFTLHDRTRMQYALLIGRTLLQDIAVVDVSRDHIQKMPKNNTNNLPLLILSRDDYQAAKKKGINPNEKYDIQQNAKVGQIAYPQNEYGNSLGTNSEQALPEVQAKREQKNNK